MKSGTSWWSSEKITNDLLWGSLSEAAKVYAKGRLVDLGCGTKPYESLFQPYVDEYFGVDWEPSSFFHYGSDTRADLFTDCANTNLEKNSFDTLLSTQVMEHIFDTQSYLQECNRLLKKGGIGIFTVPLSWETHAEPYDYYRFTRYALEILFINHGFKIEKIEPIGGAYATVLQLKINSTYFRPSRNYLYKAFRKIRNFICIPLLNYLGLNFDKILWNDKLCLNYLVVVRA